MSSSRPLAECGVTRVRQVVDRIFGGNVSSAAEALGYSKSGLNGVLDSGECSITLDLAAEALLRRTGTASKVLLACSWGRDHDKSMEKIVEAFDFEMIAEGSKLLLGPAKQCEAMMKMIGVIDGDHRKIDL